MALNSLQSLTPAGIDPKASFGQKLLGWAGASYAQALAVHLRWRESAGEEARAAIASGPAILCFWHQHVFLAARPMRGLHRPAALISRSRDGGAAAVAVRQLGILPIRASRAKKGKSNKGGLDGLVEMSAHLSAGGVLALASDGPRGPARRFSPGIAQLARFSGAPIIGIGAAVSCAARARSWDRTHLPLPFARAALAWGRPMAIDRGANGAALLACTQNLEDELNRLDGLALALLKAHP